jgi:hypothetical protein
MNITVQYGLFLALMNLVIQNAVALEELFQVQVARFLSTCSHASHRRRLLKPVHWSAPGRAQPARLPLSYEHWEYRNFKRLAAFWPDADDTFVVAVFLVGHPAIHNVLENTVLPGSRRQ